MQNNWLTFKLVDLANTLTDGDWIESKDQSPSGIRLIQTGNIGVGFFKDKSDKAHYINEATFSRLHCTEILSGDILVSRLPDPVGRACILPNLGIKCITAVDCSIIRLKDDILSKWFIYFTQSDKYFSTVKGLCTGSTRQRITRKKLGEISIPVPPLPEQQQIVDYLDGAFAKIDQLKANAEKQLQDAQSLFSAALEEAMSPKEGWEEKKFCEIAQYHKENIQEPGLIYIGMENIESNTGKMLSIASSDNILSNCFRFNKGDVLYGRLRPYLKKVVVAPFDGCCSTEIFPIKSEVVLSDFIKYWFLTDTTTNKINETCSGCRMPRGNMNEVKKFLFFYPSKQAQHSIVSHLDALSAKVNQLKENYKTILSECDALKQALLREIFE